MGFSSKIRSIMGHDDDQDDPPAPVNVANRLGRAAHSPSRSVAPARTAHLLSSEPAAEAGAREGGATGERQVLQPAGAAAPPLTSHALEDADDDRSRRPGIGERLRAAFRDDEWDEPDEEPETIDVAGRLAGWNNRQE